jgi:hypothetical protein
MPERAESGADPAKAFWKLSERRDVVCTVRFPALATAALLFVTIWGDALGDPIPADSLQRKMLLGYQGWFAAPGDGSAVEGWHHWFRGPAKPANLTVEMWPDTSEFGVEELFPTPLTLPGGRPAMLFSSHRKETVMRHFKWMEEAGIDGILLQRFIGEVQDPRFLQFRNQVTRHVVNAAQKHGRVFAIEYDMAAAQAKQVMQDWQTLVDELQLTSSPRYLHHKGKPVIGLWGLGFTHRPGTAEQAQELVEWFQTKAPLKYQATLVGGVPSGWREGLGDSLPGAQWAKLYRTFDVISPWTVGRYVDDAGADSYLRETLQADIKEANRVGADYLPVVFPGFAWQNLHQGPPNQIRRRGGRFFWRQVFNASSAGVTMIKTAMFDEVDEGTAMFKTVPNASLAPTEVATLKLDADGENLPADWYLQLAGRASGLLRGEFPLSAELPIKPAASR